MEGLYDYRTACKWNILLFCRNNITNENQDLERKENGDRVSVLVFLVFKVDIYSLSKIKHGTKQSKCSRKEKQEGERDKAFYKQNHSSCTLCVGHLSLSIIIWGFIHVVQWLNPYYTILSILQSVSLPSIIPLCGYTIVCLYIHLLKSKATANKLL